MATTSEAPTARLDVAPTAAAAVDVPRRARGVELLGLFEDSGFKEPPYLVRRGDGQVVQLAPLLYALAEEVDGRRDTAQIADALSERIQRGVSAENVEMLLDGQLRRLGIVALRHGRTAEVGKVDPLLALKFRTKVVPEGVVRALTTVFRPLFLPPVMVAAVLAFVGALAWLFGIHGISQGLRHVLYQPALLFMLLGGVVLATAFHEIGHATAVRYGGANPGVMGVGIYIVWPAFYTDITDAYRLPKRGRLRADVGGMYFNALFGLAATAAYAATRFEPLLLLVVLQAFAIVQQSLPFLRLDGYYVVSDLTGVPDMLSRIRPVLASLLPWRDADERVTELKPWVRAVVTAYVLVVVPVIALVFVLMLAHAPRAFATAWDSLHVRWHRVAGGEPAGATAQDVLQMAVLVLPCLGMLYTTSRIAGRAGRGAWRWSAPSAARRVPVLAAAGAAVACVAALWWPTSGAYRPITRHDRGTLLGAVESLRHLHVASAPSPAPAAAQAAPARTVPRRPAAAPPKRPAGTTTTTTTPASPRSVPPAQTTGSSTTTVPTTPAQTAPSDTTSTDTTPTDTTTTGTTPTDTTTTDTTSTSVYPGGE